MPLYEYSCSTCKHSFEALIFDGDKVECPACASESVNKLLSVPARPQSAVPAACQYRHAARGLPWGRPWCQRKG